MVAGPRRAVQRPAVDSEHAGKVRVLEAVARTAELFGLPVDDVAGKVVGIAAGALACERVWLYLRDDGATEPWDRFDRSGIPPGPADGCDVVELVLAARRQHQWGADGRLPLTGPWSRAHGAVHVLATPLYLQDREIGAIVAARTRPRMDAFDATDREVADAIARHTSQALAAAQLAAERDATAAQLQAANERRRIWTAGVSHDLRAPLTGMVGYLDLLAGMAGGTTHEQRAHYLEIMRRQALRVLGIVDDILLAAGAEMGAIEAGDDAVGLVAAVADIVQQFAPHHADRLVVHARDEVTVQADRSHVGRIVANLVANALLHGGKGIVEIHVGRHELLGSVSVRDHGPGVPTHLVDHLFDSFHRGGDSGGSGLGLAIARDLARANEGDLVLLPDEQGAGGAEFVLWLPRLGRAPRDWHARMRATGHEPGMLAVGS